MAKIRRGKLIFILLFFIFLLSACAKSPNLFTNLNTSQPETLSLEEIERQYESSLQEILKPGWENKEISGIKDKILALKAPTKYLDLHFNLVIAFELIEQGQKAADQAKIEDGLEKIAKLKTQYPWLE